MKVVTLDRGQVSICLEFGTGKGYRLINVMVPAHLDQDVRRWLDQAYPSLSCLPGVKGGGLRLPHPVFSEYLETAITTAAHMRDTHLEAVAQCSEVIESLRELTVVTDLL